MHNNSFFEISDIITAYIKGNITSQQMTILDNWLSEDKVNKELFENLLIDENFENTLKEYDSYNIKSAFYKVKVKKKSKVRRIKSRRIIAYAAAIALPLVVAITLLNKPEYKKDTNKYIAHNQIKVGESKAHLILSNGKNIYLKKEANDTISDNNTNIISDGGVIKYKAGKEVAVDKFNTLVVPKGGEFDIVLPDGTRVWLNSDSEMKYPLNFTGKIRKVYLKGEAYFKVAHNKKKPFIVETEGLDVKVLGTEFNVRSYSDENKLATTLVNGSVEISSRKGDRNKLILKPGYQAVLEKESGDLKSRKVDVEDFIAWKSGRFVFKHQRLEEVMIELSRWYNVQVFYQNNTVKDKMVTGIIKRYGSFNEFIRMINITEIADFKVKGKTIIIREK